MRKRPQSKLLIPLLILLFFSFVLLIATWMVRQKTYLKPRAILPEEKVNPLAIPTPLPKLPAKEDRLIPTPFCQIDDLGCTTCCIKLEGKDICQDRVCPANQPFKVE